MKRLILASRRDEDRAFFNDICLKHEIQLIVPASTAQLVEAFTAGALLVLDSDDGEFKKASYMFGAFAVFHALKEKTDPQRIFALGDGYVFQDAQLKPPYSQFTNKQIRHAILRKYAQPSALDVYGRLFDVAFRGAPPQLSDYFTGDTKIQKITLKSSTQRKLAVEALQTIMQKAGLSERLAVRLAQAGDEFLMNAIFDAPRDNIGRAIRREVDREKVFDLLDRDAVDFEIALDKQHFGVSVTDFYGSLLYDDVARSLSLDYVSSKYNVKRDTLGAGLGLYQTTYNGISTVYSVLENKFTRAMIFFPLEKSMKAFKESFEFMSSYTYKESHT